MNIDKELEVIFELRSALLEIYSGLEQTEKYLIANELLNDLEKSIRKKTKE